MAGGFVASPHPSLEEHDSYTVDFRRQVQELRAKNAKVQRQIAAITRKSEGHDKRADHIRSQLVDMEDRAKFVRVAQAAATQPKGNSAADIFYQEQNAKVRDTALSLLAAEASKFSPDSPGSSSSPSKRSTRSRQPVRQVPSNFSPFQGWTENHTQRQQPIVLLGLRGPPQRGAKPGRLPSLLPRESPHDHHRFMRPNASNLSRTGTLTDLGRSRARISELTTSRSTTF